jgi:hypothetical protein
VYPSVRGLELRWVPDNSDPTGILVIHVPAQSQNEKHFLVARMVDATNRMTECAIGVPIREGDQASWARPGEIHRLVADGLRGTREVEVQNLDQHVAEVEARAFNITQDLDRWTSPLYVLEAHPPLGPSPLPGLFGSEGIQGALQNPPGIRPHGFGLRVVPQIEVERGALTNRTSERVNIWLDRDGLFVTCANATERFLARSEPRDAAAPLLINPVVLVEFTLEFCRFVHAYLKPRAGLGPWSLFVGFRGFRTRRQITLAPGPVPPDGADLSLWDREGLPASADDARDEIVSGETASQDAFKLLAHFYSYFGLPEASIPYASAGEISEEQIRRLG